MMNLKRKLKVQKVFSDLDEEFELTVEYARDQIEIRIESLKIELDSLGVKLNEKIDRIVEQRKEIIESNLPDLSNLTDQYNHKANQLDNYIKQESKMEASVLYKHQNELIEFNNKLKEMKAKILHCG